MIKPNR